MQPNNMFRDIYFSNTDAEYAEYGVNIVSRDEVLQQDIICDPKIGDANYLEQLNNQTIFGWVHAVQTEILRIN